MLRARPETKDKIREAARAAGMPMAAWARKALEERARIETEGDYTEIVAALVLAELRCRLLHAQLCLAGPAGNREEIERLKRLKRGARSALREIAIDIGGEDGAEFTRAVASRMADVAIAEAGVDA